MPGFSPTQDFVAAARDKNPNLLDRVSPQVSKWDSLTSANRDACLFDATQKLRVMLEPILEPILFRRKADQDAGRTTVPRNHDLFVDREPQILGEVILYLRQSHFFRALALVCLVRRATTALRPS